jgi:hypothetical protein
MTPTRVPKQWVALQRRRHGIDPEAGQAVSEVLMYGAIIVGVVVVIGAALQALGVNIVGRIGDALGV